MPDVLVQISMKFNMDVSFRTVNCLIIQLYYQMAPTAQERGRASHDETPTFLVKLNYWQNIISLFSTNIYLLSLTLNTRKRHTNGTRVYRQQFTSRE